MNEFRALLDVWRAFLNGYSADFFAHSIVACLNE